MFGYHIQNHYHISHERMRKLTYIWTYLYTLNDVMMSVMASQITSVSIVCSTVCSRVDQTKRQSSASLAFVRGIHRWPVNSPHKGPVTRKMLPFDDVILYVRILQSTYGCFLLFSPLKPSVRNNCTWTTMRYTKVITFVISLSVPVVWIVIKHCSALYWNGLD